MQILSLKTKESFGGCWRPWGFFISLEMKGDDIFTGGVKFTFFIDISLSLSAGEYKN